MTEYNGFSAHASLAMIGLWMQEKRIWEQIEEHVQIGQKTVKHTPHDKLKDALINILAGGHGLVEINTKVRSDLCLQLAFGRKECAEQSVVSEMLNACSQDNVQQMEGVLRSLYQELSQGYGHNYARQCLLLDIDFSGLLAGKQAEGASKGYFSGARNARGRQVGRVVATQYDEIVCEQLYKGSVQLEKGLIGLVEMAENVLNLDEEKRKRTILRIDAGGGTDANINWGLLRGYLWMSKVKNWPRTKKLAAPISDWLPLPALPGHEAAWVPTPHVYQQPMRQLAVRWPERKGGWQVCVLIFNLSDEQIFQLAGQTPDPDPTQAALLSAIVSAYNLRGGGIETSFKNSHQALGLNKRNKKSFHAQSILVLLAQLAYNLLSWVRHELANAQATFASFGMLRLVRDVFGIAGILHFDDHCRLVHIVLNQANTLAKRFIPTWHLVLPHTDLSPILGKI